jgi:putative OPT family oligopeptide transporter
LKDEPYRRIEVLSARTKAFKPYTSCTNNKVRELTVRGMILGVILAVIFGVGNAFLGLKVGSTVSASIPAAVMSMAILKVFCRNVSILENNIVQTVASAGEGLAGGVIFTIPALMFMGLHPSRLEISLLAFIGGILGVALMVPLREHIVVAEHGRLPFPEGTACAEILKSGQGEPEGVMPAVVGVLMGGFFRICISIFHLWSETTTWIFPFYERSQFSVDATPALLGVGYLIGPRISSFMLAGSLLAWWVLIPVISFFGAGASAIFPASEAIHLMSADQIWSNYIRYIGAGAVAIGGILGLVRIVPVMGRMISAAFDEFKKSHVKKTVENRCHRDIDMKYLLLAFVVILLILWLVPAFPLNALSVLMMAIFAFFFIAVTSFTVGFIGTSSNPLSGMILTTILITCSVYYSLGWTSSAYFVSAITLGSLVSIATAIAADTTQDLKTGHLVGATPYKQQIAMLVGVTVSAGVMGFALYLLNSAFQLGSMAMPAPQATLLFLVAKGVLHGDLPMTLMIIGAMIAIVMRIIKIPVMPFAMGMYLPLALNIAIIFGGIVAGVLKNRLSNQHVKKRGILIASGLVGGDSILGVVAAFLAVSGLITATKAPLLPSEVGFALYILISIVMGVYAARTKSKKRQKKKA